MLGLSIRINVTLGLLEVIPGLVYTGPYLMNKLAYVHV